MPLYILKTGFLPDLFNCTSFQRGLSKGGWTIRKKNVYKNHAATPQLAKAFIPPKSTSVYFWGWSWGQKRISNFIQFLTIIVKKCSME
jgi:hypothetical protein